MKPIALLLADIHLSHQVPAWRSAEPNWYAAMARTLNQVKDIQTKLGDIPILCAGDVFDRWGRPGDKFTTPELINFAIREMPPRFYAVPGQHDLPNHVLADIERSAFQTLRSAGKIETTLVGPIHSTRIHNENFDVYGFPPMASKDVPVIRKPPRSHSHKRMKVALVHDYVWFKKAKFDNAPEDKELTSARLQKHMVRGKLYGYDVIVYGDNHKTFLTKIGKTTVFNCGTLMRRKKDERKYKPNIGILYDDGTVKPRRLDISEDRFVEDESQIKEEEARRVASDMSAMVHALGRLGLDDLDVEAAFDEYFKARRTRKFIRQIIKAAMEDTHGSNIETLFPEI